MLAGVEEAVHAIKPPEMIQGAEKNCSENTSPPPRDVTLIPPSGLPREAEGFAVVPKSHRYFHFF
jgi:hypothetical protein